MEFVNATTFLRKYHVLLCNRPVRYIWCEENNIISCPGFVFASVPDFLVMCL
jgi:hypothetical protein